MSDPADKGYVRACRTADVPAIMPLRFTHEGAQLLICRDGDALHAVAERCPHRDLSMAFGIVQGGQIICPHHQYAFDLETGASSARRCDALPTYPLVVTPDGQVWVKP